MNNSRQTLGLDEEALWKRQFRNQCLHYL